MKNIFIVGVPRSGKTTLSKKIKLNYPDLNIISFEAIRNAFIKSQPNLNMENRNSIARKEILPQFLIEFVHWNNSISNYGNIVEGDFTDIKTLVNNMESQDLVICLGLGERTIEEIVDSIIKNDTEYDYTNKWSREKIQMHFSDITQKDKENYKLCQNYNLLYFDTFSNRQEAFSNIIKYIESKF